jgi:hypothetical protein
MRLNKELRTKIVENAYKASPIPEAKKALTARSMALAENIRLDGLAAFNAGDLDTNLAVVEKEFSELLKRRGIPENFIPSSIFNRSSDVYVKLGEESRPIYFSGAIYSKNRSRDIVVSPDGYVFSKKFYSPVHMEYPSDHEFTQEFRSIISDAEDLIEQTKILRNTVQAAVDSFATVEKLVEHWPECATLIPKEVSAASQPMPIALQTDTLNKLIGLPK